MWKVVVVASVFDLVSFTINSFVILFSDLFLSSGRMGRLLQYRYGLTQSCYNLVIVEIVK